MEQLKIQVNEVIFELLFFSNLFANVLARGRLFSQNRNLIDELKKNELEVLKMQKNLDEKRNTFSF